MQIEISSLEIVALHKLYQVNIALADMIGGAAGREQAALASVLSAIIDRGTIALAKEQRET